MKPDEAGCFRLIHYCLLQQGFQFTIDFPIIFDFEILSDLLITMSIVPWLLLTVSLKLPVQLRLHTVKKQVKDIEISLTVTKI